MNLGRFSLDNAPGPALQAVAFTHDQRHLVALEEGGYSVWRTYPLMLLRKKDLDGTLAAAVPLPNTALLALQGGGKSPLYPPNKVVIWHDALERPVASLEFKQRIRFISARTNSLFVVLSTSVIQFDFGLSAAAPSGYEDGRDSEGSTLGRSGWKGKGKERDVSGGDREGFWIIKRASWKTCENEKGLIALATAPGSSLLAIPGRQPGHIQLLQLDPCPSTTAISTTDHIHPTPSNFPSEAGTSSPSSQPVSAPPAPSASSILVSSSVATLTDDKPTTSFRTPIIMAHTHSLSCLSCDPTGQTLLTASSQGTLLRVWDVSSGRLERELRRGVDKAEIWGVTFPSLGMVRSLQEGGMGGKGKAGDGLVAGWSDKGTIHVWADTPAADASGSPEKGKSKTKKSKVQKIGALLDKNLSLPRYFRSQPSFALFRLSRQMSAQHSRSQSNPSLSAASYSREAEFGELALQDRFIVTWLNVEDDAEEPPPPARPSLIRNSSGGSKASRGSFQQGSRRGSGSTVDSPSDRGARRKLFEKQHQQQHGSPLASPNPNSAARSAGGGPGLQLVAITFGGDWYRIGVPPPGGVGEGEGDQSGGEDGDGLEEGKQEGAARRGDRCTLLEYRRMSTAAGGW